MQCILIILIPHFVLCPLLLVPPPPRAQESLREEGQKDGKSRKLWMDAVKWGLSGTTGQLHTWTSQHGEVSKVPCQLGEEESLVRWPHSSGRAHILHRMDSINWFQWIYNWILKLDLACPEWGKSNCNPRSFPSPTRRQINTTLPISHVLTGHWLSRLSQPGWHSVAEINFIPRFRK